MMTIFMPSVGIVGSIIYSLVLTKYPNKMMLGLYSIVIGLILSWIFFYYVDTQANRTMLCVASGAIGFFLFPLIFVCFEIAVE